MSFGMNYPAASNDPIAPQDELAKKARNSLWEMTVLSSGVVKPGRETVKLMEGLSVELWDNNKLRTADKVVGALRNQGLIEEDTNLGVPDNLRKGFFVSIGSNLEVAQTQGGRVVLTLKKPESMSLEGLQKNLERAEEAARQAVWEEAKRPKETKGKSL